MSVHNLPKNLPSAIDAERSLLGALFMHPPSLAMVADLVRAEDFTDPVHTVIYHAILTLDGASKPIDAVSVAAQVASTDDAFKLRSKGGPAYLGELTDACVSVENIEHHAHLIADAARRTRTMAAADELRCLALRGEEGWDETGGTAVFRALEQRRSDTSATFGEIAVMVAAEVERRHEAGAILGLSTGLERINGLLGGLHPHRQYVIAGRPGTGKTCLATGFCIEAAKVCRAPSLFFSAEMDQLSLVQRATCAEARIDTQRVEQGRMTGDDWRRWSPTLGRIAAMPITVDQQSAPTLLDIRTKARRWRAAQTPEQQAQPAIIVVDYLQLVEHQQGKGEKLTDAIGRTSRGLKALAKDLHCATVVLSQLNRESERDSRRPRMSDLRDSGAIEADADAIIFLHNPDPKVAIAVDATVAKHRFGPTGVAKLAFHRQWTRFDALTDRDLEPRKPSVAASSPPPPQREYQTSAFDAEPT
jgi:replicative DNA helicase